MFELLEVEAALGRTFAPGEDGPGGADVVVLRHGLWQRRYGGDPGIVGETILLDGTPHTVVGVMPPDFNFPFGGVRMWTPLREDPATEPRERANLLPVGRLKADWTRARAQAELEAIQSESIPRPTASSRVSTCSRSGPRSTSAMRSWSWPLPCSSSL